MTRMSDMKTMADPERKSLGNKRTLEFKSLQIIV
jgi:hypothetical protein